MEKGLPPGWVLANVESLGEFINGFAFKPSDWAGQGTPIIRIQNLTDPGKPLNRTGRSVDEKYVVKRDDILVSWSATLNAFRWKGPSAYLNQHIFKVVPEAELDSHFVYIALREAIEELVNSEHLHGTTMKHINRKPFLTHPVPLPPLNEQRRIVEKIETLFARMDHGEAMLREVQSLLARHRQSALKSALTGQLTANWRAENACRLEHGRDLLARILQNRRAAWQGRGRYQEPVAPDTTAMPELPEEWVWASLDSLIIDGPTNGVSPRESSGSSCLSFKLTATTSGKFVISEETVKPVDFKPKEDSNHWLRSGDVLVQRGNTIEYVGTAAVFPGPDKTYIYPDLMMRIRFAQPLLAEWSVMWINSGYAKRHFQRLATGTAGNMPKINGMTLKTLAVPLPPHCEIQHLSELLRGVDSKSSLISEWCTTELARSAALRQSILKDALAGRLVPQDPNDESATELLARIRASRKAVSKHSTRKKAKA